MKEGMYDLSLLTSFKTSYYTLALTTPLSPKNKLMKYIILFAGTWLDLESVILSEVRQRRNIMIPFTCGI